MCVGGVVCLFVLVKVLLKNNSHAIFFAHLKYTVQLFLTKHATTTKSILEYSHHSKRSPVHLATTLLLFTSFPSTLQFSSVEFSCSVVSDSATPWITARQALLSITTPGVHSDSCPSSQWCHPAIPSSSHKAAFCLYRFAYSALSCKWNYIICIFFDWLLWLSIRFSRFTHVLACMDTLFLFLVK